MNTATKEEAANKAAELYMAVIHRGWDQVLASIKTPKTPKALRPPVAPAPAPSAALPPVTIGAVIEASMRLSTASPRSKEMYAGALRRIVAGAFEIDKGNWDSPSPRHFAKWRAKVDAIPLADLTPAKVLSWRNRYLEKASLANRDSAAVSVNYFLRNARAIFSRKVMPFLEQEMKLPSPLFFEGITREREPSPRYRSRIDAAALLSAAQSELATADPEAFKMLLLSLVFGLRRSEADTLLWSQFDFDRNILRIEDTEEHRLKSRDSADDVDMDPETCALFRGLYAKAKDRRFVLETTLRPGHQPKTRYYRAEGTQRRLMAWLREKGVTDRKPIHTLRKEIGAIIASREGIYAASRYLRHADIQTTTRFYADKKKPITAGLGAILSQSPSNVVEADFASSHPGAEPNDNEAISSR